MLHTSGALSSEVLTPLRKQDWSTGSLHPLVSVSEPKAGARLLRNAFWCVEGDKRAVRLARTIVRDLDGKSFSMSSKKKPLYHASAVMASGNVTALFDVALETTRVWTHAQPAQQSVAAVTDERSKKPRKARSRGGTTGTFARGDLETVKRHLDALKNNRPARTLPVARSQILAMSARGLDPAMVKRIRRLIG